MKTVAALLLFFVLPAAAQDASHNMDSCPMHKDHMKTAHQDDVEKHGDQAMGFPHNKTTHHFRLYVDGGAIEVTANDSNDAANRDAIRAHMTHIAKLFSSGDFSIPMFVHNEVPPGVPIMKEKRTEISYSFEDLPAGASVRIKTANPEALNAIYEFLRFQIEDHHTGDAATVNGDTH
jgi:hypothetical protein